MHSKSSTYSGFPCRFPLKILTQAETDIQGFVQETLEKTLQDPSNIEFTSRLSHTGKYRSITALFTLSNTEELRKIDETLSQHKAILWKM